MNDSKYSYLGNPRIKRSGVEMSFTQSQMKEYLKCAQDPIYFTRSYVKIVNVDGGLIPFDMYDYQERMIDHIADHRFSSICCARQIGKSTVTVAFLLWFILFHDYKNIGILANKGKTSRQILKRLKLAYEHLPFWMQSGVVKWNEGDIELENGSRIGAYAAASDAARGESFSMLFVDEVAFVEPGVWDEYYKSSYPTIASGKDTKIILVSTPNGLNHFYNIHQGARDKKNAYAPFEVIWSDVPGRDEKWKAETILNTSEEAFEQEHCCVFHGNSNSLINAAVLRRMSPEPPIGGSDTIKIYDNPQPGHVYVLTADVARGVGGDYSAFSVIDITEYPYRQVLTYRNNEISPLSYPNVIENIATKYNKAFVLVETNDIGEAVASTLNYEFEYENLLSVKSHGMKKARIGIRVTKPTKKIGCSRLKDLVESYKLLVEDENTIEEFFHFQEKGDSFEADMGHDDLVMGLVNFAYLVDTPLFKELSRHDFRVEFGKSRIKQLEQELLPVPSIDDGLAHAATIAPDGAIYSRERDFVS